MRRRVGIARVVGALLAAQMTMAAALPVTALAADAAGPTAATTAERGVPASVVARMPVGTGAGEVGVEETPEGPWGVAAFALGPDGTVHVVDGVNDKVLVFDSLGSLVQETPLPDPLVAPEDIAVTTDGTYLLDVAAQPPLVCRLGRDGSVERQWLIPEEHLTHAVTAITVRNDQGEDVFLELEGSWTVPFVEDGELVRPRRLPLLRRGSRADVPAAGAAAYGLRGRNGQSRYVTTIDAESDRSGIVRAIMSSGRECRLEVRTQGQLGRLKGLDGDSAGRHFVVVDDVGEGPGEGSTEVRLFSDEGTHIGTFAVPSGRFHTSPNQYLRVDADGLVYCLVAGAREVTVERLTMDAPRVSAEMSGQSLTEFPHSGANTRSARFWEWLRTCLSPQTALAVWDRTDASDRAWQYVYTTWYCNAANYSRSCGDYRPAYITASGRTYAAVPYCWGGFDTASTFKTAMSNDKDAGDVNTSGTKRYCTAGVDCSGFVSRIWGLGTKYSTSSLPNISYRIDRKNMRLADLYLWPNHHAIAFRYFTSTGDSAVWESTMTSDKDRVVAWTRTAKYLADPLHYYYTRRYNAW